MVGQHDRQELTATANRSLDQWRVKCLIEHSPRFHLVRVLRGFYLSLPRSMAWLAKCSILVHLRRCGAFSEAGSARKKEWWRVEPA
jgi:hypothetical protein